MATIEQEAIASVFLPKDPEFAKLKRKRIWDDWGLLVSGEWSQSPYHYGKHRFLYSVSKDQGYMRILHMSFPPTILVIGLRLHNEDLAQLATRLLNEIKAEYGYYIDMAYDGGDLDIDI
jgi:hypothetical protein